MLKSMTGYGRGIYEHEGRQYTVEIRSVNHKYCDISIKMPRSIGYLEDQVKKYVSNQIHRGKIDIFISFSNNSEKGRDIHINQSLAQEYLKEISLLAEKNNLEQSINVMDILKLPDVLNLENTEDEEELWTELSFALQLAVQQFIQMRETEGAKMAEDMKQRIQLIQEKTQEMSSYSASLVEEYITKLEERIKELLKTDVVDQTRLAQEVVIYADKTSIQEELTRLKSHMNQFLKFLEQDDAIGKKMDFLVQEMNREINTIGSKANKLEITNLVVEVKTILEDIREQVQNIE